MKIIFMGTPDFAVASLNALVEAGFTPMMVVTHPDRKKGRGRKMVPTAVKSAALGFDIPVLEVESVKDPEFANQIAELTPDLIVVVAFRILPPAVYECAKLGAFNLHGSLLPAYRGAAPIHRAVMEGVKETGVTTFFLQQKVDTGNMIMQRAMPVGENETTGEVHDRMMMMGAEVVVETVKLIDDGAVKTTEQDNNLASPARKIFKDDCRVDWAKPATEIHNHIRGLSPFPGAWTLNNGEPFKLYQSEMAVCEATDHEPGTIVEILKDRLVVACGEGAVALLEIQQQGRKRMSVQAYLNGMKSMSGVGIEVGTRLG